MIGLGKRFLLLALLAVPAELAPAGDAPSPGGVQAVVTTVDDQQTSAVLAGVENGQLRLATEPPRTIPLDDLLRVEVGKAVAAPTSNDLSWIGQDNQDLVQVGSAGGGNGVQDLHLHARNLKPLPLKQIIVTCRFPKRVRVWRLDTSLSPHWRLAVVRSDVASEAELYLEPDSLDAFEQTFEVQYTYGDGSTAKSSVVASTHTSDQLKLDKSAQPGVAAAAPASAKSQAEVQLADGYRLYGPIQQLTSDTLTLKTAWQEALQVPLVRVRSVWFGQTAPSGAREAFDQRSAQPVNDDVVFLLAPDKSAASVQGSFQSLREGRLVLRYEGADRNIKQERLLGLVLAAQAKLPAAAETYQVFRLQDGSSLAARWVGLADGKFELETFWQSRLQVPATDVAEIRTRNGKLTYLSELEPSGVEETAYFGRVVAWRRDAGFGGEPAKIKGSPVPRCVAMHSRTVLTYPLDGLYETFKTKLAFDDSAGQRGRVACRILLDGREAYKQQDFRSTQDPQDIELPLQGAKQLTLEVDFGEDEDTGDRILWAEPRLFRAAAATGG